VSAHAEERDPSTGLPVLTTRVGRAGSGDHRYFGHGTFTELLGTENYAGVMAMAVCGRRICDDDRRMLDDLSVIMSAADPRIPPLKLCRLLASYGSVLASFAGAQLCLENDLIGPWTTRYAAETLVELRRLVGDRIDDAAFVEAEMNALLQRKKRLVGYGVPLRRRDERLDALRAEVTRRGWHARPFWQLQEAFSILVQSQRKLGSNLATGVSALLLDMGFSVEEVPALTTFLMQNCFAANAVEGARQAPAILRALPPDTVTYVGLPPRASPRAG
jgi:hypothetical protein